MQCSSCSHEVKPIVAFDIDGTLGDYHGQLIEFAELYTGRPVGMGDRPFDGTMNFGDWMQEAFHIPSRKEYRDLKLAFRQGGTKRWMPPHTDMINAVRTARLTGCEIWLTTTRPYLRLDSVDPDTREWIHRNDVPFDHLMYDEHKYEVLAGYVDPERVILIVDDLLEQVEEATEVWTGNGLSSPAVLYRCQYNSGCDWRGQQVEDGERLEELLAERVERWSIKYGEPANGELGTKRLGYSGSKHPTGGWATSGERN